MFSNIKFLLLYVMVATSEEDEGFVATLPADHDYAMMEEVAVTTVVVTITTITTTTTTSTTTTTATTTTPVRAHLTVGDMISKRTTIRAETMVCFTAFSPHLDQMPIFGLLLVFFLLKSLHFMNFPQNDNW